ncbi:MAG: glycosyltransferase, partial [Tolypothrix sp. T3-bin4]|nr:glycosyltransferase [Tolypothrix sp. T3-bin4]
MIYLLIVNYYSTDFIIRLIHSFSSSQTIPHQIVIINNSPNDHALQELKDDRILILEAKANLGFGKACNLGLNWIYDQDNQAIAWIINPDTYMPETTLEKVPGLFEDYPVSILGTLIYTP